MNSKSFFQGSRRAAIGLVGTSKVGKAFQQIQLFNIYGDSRSVSADTSKKLGLISSGDQTANAP